MQDQPESLRMLFAELEPLKIRPWNILRVLPKMLRVQKRIVQALVGHESMLGIATDTIETSVAINMSLEGRIDKLWQEVYERQEKDIARLELKLETFLATIREEDKDGE